MKMHSLELVQNEHGGCASYLNGRKIDITSLNISLDCESRETSVTMDVIQRPYRMDGEDDIKRWTWTLCPCRVHGEIPANLYYR